MNINEEDIKSIITRTQEIESEISKNIIGQKEVVRNLVICIIVGGNVLLEGVPGLGKTTLVKTIGKVMDLSFSRIQFTPDLMPTDVVGTNIVAKSANQNLEFKFQPGPVFSNIVLADEINRATPKTQSALLEAMQEHTVTVANVTHNLPQPFFVLATQNPIEMEGTYPLPEAQMDRFMFKIFVKFPNLQELTKIVNITSNTQMEEPNKITNSKELLKMREIAAQTPISESVMEFAMKLVLATHPLNDDSPEITKKYISYGSSPRGAQAIIKAAKILALLEGRFNVSYDDIKTIAPVCLSHRIALNFEAVSDNITVEKIINEIINTINK